MSSILNQRRCRKESGLELENECIEEEGQGVSTQFLQTRKNQLNDLQDQLQKYCNVLPDFGFNSAKYDNFLRENYLLPLLVSERGNNPIVIKIANQFVSFKFGDVQLFDVLNFLVGATRLDSFLTAEKTSETKRFSPYKWFNDPEKQNNTQIPS